MRSARWSASAFWCRSRGSQRPRQIPQGSGGRRGARLHGVEPLAGKSTLNRLELSAAGFNGKKARKIVADFVRMDDLLVENCEEALRQIVLDIDATDFELHGDQEDRFFHGYYDE